MNITIWAQYILDNDEDITIWAQYILDNDEDITIWAQYILDNDEDINRCYQATVSYNIISRSFVQAAADNSDYILETLTGKTSMHF